MSGRVAGSTSPPSGGSKVENDQARLAGQDARDQRSSPRAILAFGRLPVLVAPRQCGSPVGVDLVTQAFAQPFNVGMAYPVPDPGIPSAERLLRHGARYGRQIQP